MYTAQKVDVPTSQHHKLKSAISKRGGVTIKVGVHGDGNHLLLLTNSQLERMERARLIGKPPESIHMSKKQVQSNISHSGGFLGMLAGLAARALPTLLGGLATGVLSGAVSKAVGGHGLRLHPSSYSRRYGDGLYLNKSGHCVKIEPTKGKGLRLSPSRVPSLPSSDGLYWKHGSDVYNGEGLIFGRNSPFKNIPILNLLL